MKSALCLKLCQEFPLLYGNNFYFECGNGWFDLIYQLSKDIFSIVQHFEIDKEKNINFPCVGQVKEKFGGLRFYMDYCHNLDLIAELISEAENESFKICEACGLPGKLITGNCWAVLCKDHGGINNE